MPQLHGGVTITDEHPVEEVSRALMAGSFGDGVTAVVDDDGIDERWNGRSRPSSQQPTTTRPPRRAIAAANAADSRDLPIPASPRTTAMVVRTVARSQHSNSRASSGARPMHDPRCSMPSRCSGIEGTRWVWMASNDLGASD